MPPRVTTWVAAFCGVLTLASCHGAPPEKAEPPLVARQMPAASAGVAPPSSVALAPSTAAPALGASARRPEADASFRFPPADRVVAIGDLHGDVVAARRALVLAGAIDEKERWVGGTLVVVQTGDEIDRGDGDRTIIELFDRIADAAQARGGRVLPLIGNHEAINVAEDFRYVTRGGFAAFSDVDTARVPRSILEQFPREARGRVAAFFPGGPAARRLAERRAVVVVGDTVFVHGGVTSDHVHYGISRLNRELSRWMSGDGPPSALANDPEGPLWTRRYSDDKSGVDCGGLEAALAALSAKRMVVGHTPHPEGVSAACDGRVWRIDTGLSAYYGGPMEILEIRGDRVSVLKGTSARR